jgi:large subunit ribosomal protein L4e
MKGEILGIDGTKRGEMELPKYFEYPVRKDLIKRAFLSWQSEQRQPYGASWLAGKRGSASGIISHQRRAWKGGYGKGISRIPRKIMSRNGSSFNWVGAFISGTRGGREAHPPKAEKDWRKKINKKENKKALYSAIAATVSPDIIKKRYKNADEAIIKKLKFPIIVEEKILEVKKIKEIKQIFEKLLNGLIKTALPKKRFRAGKGKMRSRPYKKQKGLLLVTAKGGLISARNLGIETVDVANLNIGHLAPGGEEGRLTVYTENAIRELNKK